jgi:hypothetical protein
LSECWMLFVVFQCWMERNWPLTRDPLMQCVKWWSWNQEKAKRTSSKLTSLKRLKIPFGLPHSKWLCTNFLPSILAFSFSLCVWLYLLSISN